MKKFVTLLTTGLLTVMLSTTVCAETAPDVWNTGSREAKTTYRVSIETNGKAADGVTEIKFDKAALSCEENDIVVSDTVDMYSVNVEDGCVKVSYLAAEAIKEGTIFTVTFDVNKAYAEEDVTAIVSSVAHDEAGDALATGTIEEEEETEDTEDTEAAEETEDTEEAENTEDSEKPENDDKKDDTIHISGQVSVDNGWQKAIASLAHITENGTLEIIMNNGTVVPKEFLDALKGLNVNVVFILNNGIKWTINGTTITGETTGIDFGVTLDSDNIPAEVVSSLVNGRTYTEISLAHSGEFGCQAVMTISQGNDNAGKYANLYYYNPATGKMEAVTSAQILADGSAALTFTHASDYVIVVDTSAVKSAATGDNNFAAAGILILFAGLIVVAFAVKKKKA